MVLNMKIAPHGGGTGGGGGGGGVARVQRGCSTHSVPLHLRRCDIDQKKT